MLQTIKSRWTERYPVFRRFVLVSIILYPFLNYVAKGILSYLFKRVLGQANMTGLTTANFAQLFKHPLAILLFLVYLVLLTATVIFEYTVLTRAVTGQTQRKDIISTFKQLPQKAEELLSPQLFFFVLYLIILLPIANWGLNSTLLQRFKIPSFISGELLKTTQGTWLYGGLMTLVVYLNIRLIYFLPLYIIGNDTPRQAMKHSWDLSRRKTLSNVSRWLLPTALAFLLVSLLDTGLVGLFTLLDPQGDSLLLETAFYSGITGFSFILNLSVKYFIISMVCRHLLSLGKIAEQKTKAFPYQRTGRWLIGATLIFWLGYNALDLYLVQANPSEVMIAHRGDVENGVENSIQAMQAAHKAGANFSEMDVLITRDKKFVIAHDNNLKRLAGIDKNISDMTLSQVRKVTLKENGFTSKIPTLEEFLAASDKIHQKLFIELKLTGNEPGDYKKRITAELKRLKVWEQGHRVMSMDKSTIEYVETKLPQIITGYLISFQFGPLAKTKTDFYAVEEFSYNDLFALYAESQKKDVYVWTINDEPTMQRILISSANGVITDKLDLFKEIKKDQKQNQSYFDRAMRLWDIKQ
ncbi:glycerophosphodiester phosphodiesterase [uncultured Streptococcus sp.]|uniref:glycerophosphodiester phosphodiesterase n=1 Tax=uncultured Streptococcus sp. TaxID=83427 RepID=UPI0027DE32F9|nr:glycerophosphodiester phosphodiesterase [uncultured Streptococcus sp.]